MEIKLIKATRKSDNQVDVEYSVDGVSVTVEWNNIHPGTGEEAEYDLQLNTKSDDAELALRIDDAIREGETDENDDIELYLAVRDTFDAMDCQDA